MATGLYDKSSGGYNPYGNENEVVDGINLRQEMRDLIWDEARGSDVIYRRAKMTNGQPQKCECTKNNRSHEPDIDIPCDICSGLGYYYEDILTKCYINHSQAYSIYKKGKQPGDSQVEYRTAYFEWDFLKRSINDSHNIPTRFDQIIELEKDLEGKIMSPTIPREIYEILSVDPYRLDNSGRIEYYRCRIISVIDKSFLV